jgi:hypothetical protein
MACSSWFYRRKKDWKREREREREKRGIERRRERDKERDGERARESGRERESRREKGEIERQGVWGREEMREREQRERFEWNRETENRETGSKKRWCIPHPVEWMMNAMKYFINRRSVSDWMKSHLPLLTLSLPRFLAFSLSHSMFLCQNQREQERDRSVGKREEGEGASGMKERERGRQRSSVPSSSSLSAFTHLRLSSPLSLSLLSLSFSKSSVSRTKIFFTFFSLMLAPFRSRISTTSPFPLAAAQCNGVWNQKHQKYISAPSLVNVNIHPAIKDIQLCIIHPSIWKSSSNPCSSCHSHIQWSIPPEITANQPNEKRYGGERKIGRERERGKERERGRMKCTHFCWMNDGCDEMFHKPKRCEWSNEISRSTSFLFLSLSLDHSSCQNQRKRGRTREWEWTGGEWKEGWSSAPISAPSLSPLFLCSLSQNHLILQQKYFLHLFHWRWLHSAPESPQHLLFLSQLQCVMESEIKTSKIYFCTNVNIPSVIIYITLCIILPSIWKSSSSPNPCSSCHSHIQWSVPPWDNHRSTKWEERRRREEDRKVEREGEREERGRETRRERDKERDGERARESGRERESRREKGEIERAREAGSLRKGGNEKEEKEGGRESKGREREREKDGEGGK